MKKKILASLIILIPSIFTFLFYIKKKLTNLKDFDIFDIHLDEEEE